VYQQRVGDGGSFVASPVAAAGRLYIASEDGDVYVVKTGSQYELLAKNSVGEPVLATPALAGDLLLVRGAKHLFAIAESAAK
jgi:outer membrane protein assembly factor BamB